MGQREDRVEEIVRNVIVNYFKKDLFDEGANILYRVYLEDYQYLDNMCSKRNLLFHLIVGEKNRKEPNKNAVAMYSTQLKQDMDHTYNYKKEYLGEYLSMMSYYTDCEGIKINDEEKISYYNCSISYNEKMYKFHIIQNPKEAFKCYIKMKNAEFNKSKLQKNFKYILLIIRELHNSNEHRAKITVEQMLCDIESLDIKLYNDALKIVNNVSKYCI